MIFFRQNPEKRRVPVAFAGVLVLPGGFGILAANGVEALKQSLFNPALWLGAIALIAAVYFFLPVLPKLFSWKNRRILRGKIKRPFKREFWSGRLFYLPLVCYIFYLSIRHRSPLVFTCANPALLAGGFVGESKSKILHGLDRSIAAQPFLLKYLFLARECAATEKLKKASDFMAKNRLQFPVVLKPDVGARGRGVHIVATRRDLIEKLKSSENQILQEYAPGNEASIFYYRNPSAPSGKILAATEKRFPSLEGDGRSTLEELILLDPNAVCRAEKFLKANRERLGEIPAKGEKIQLTDLGNHSRGTIYLEASRLITRDLERKIDDICRGFDGFYFGRLDVRVPCLNDLEKAENFKIIEINGIASDATKIYDPRHSIVEAYRSLFRQWKIAFEIGAENRRRGAQPTGIADFFRLSLGKPVKTTASDIRDPKCV